MQLQQVVRQLQLAEKAIDENELPEASVRIQAAKGILVKLGGKLK
ncbi:hypothetical protein [Pasteurella multocida]|nr:hypothetical protein [Pasteurella multocida]MDA5607040.1 hypothetical protein [Pasteurella multocida subsp. multocida]MDA5614697.1 hypothetical protein [Pasteurella multocida]MDA5624580.1 hypothetical protein [Pasteurella multocida]